MYAQSTLLKLCVHCQTILGLGKGKIKHLWISKMIKGLQYSQGVLECNGQDADCTQN